MRMKLPDSLSGRARKESFRTRGWGILLFLVAVVGGFELAADPVAEALANRGKFVIETEDFDFGGGKHVAHASVMPYAGGDYEGLAGVSGVDFLRAPVADFPLVYRAGESPIVPIFEQSSEAWMDRGTWKVLRNHSLAYCEAGQWFNYTRLIPRGGYRVWVAAASADSSPSGIQGRLQRVIQGAGTSNQVVEDLGVLDAPGSGSWGTLSLVPFRPLSGELLWDLGGPSPTTLRYVPILGDVDFILLEMVFHIDPATLLKAELDGQGRRVIHLIRGLPRPRVLQGAATLSGSSTEWKDVAWDFFQPFLVPEDSEFRFFRLLLD